MFARGDFVINTASPHAARIWSHVGNGYTVWSRFRGFHLMRSDSVRLATPDEIEAIMESWIGNRAGYKVDHAALDELERMLEL